MNSFHNMISQQQTITNNEIQNKGFLFLDDLFKENGWQRIRNDLNWIMYTKNGYETDFFEIKINTKSIHVCVPLKNSLYQYKTSFNNYFETSEYIEKMLKDYII